MSEAEPGSLAPWEALYTVVKQLRAPDGCPWDQAQTPESLVPYLLEEAHETAEALRSGDASAAAEELGDLILNIMLQTAIAEESQSFSLAEVLTATREKVIRRHPHVFGDQSGADLATIRRNWQRIKSEEKPGRVAKSRVLRELPETLPALEQAERLGRDAARVGFDWPNHHGVRAKIDEELAELDEAIGTGEADRIEHELGDLLLAVTSLARHCSISSESSLRGTLRRFRRRFERMESRMSDLESASLEELEAAWNRAKRDEAASEESP